MNTQRGNYTKLSLGRLSHMTPTAAKLYEYVASRRPNPPPALALEAFRQLCGIKGTSANAWIHEVERACRELVSAGAVESARVEAGEIHFQIEQ